MKGGDRQQKEPHVALAGRSFGLCRAGTPLELSVTGSKIAEGPSRRMTMTTSWKPICCSAALVLVVSVLGGSSWADKIDAPPSPEELMKLLTEAGKPGPEHAKLEPLVGSWTYTGKFWMDPSKPPVEAKGAAERTWVLGGRFLEERIEGTGFDGKPGFEARGLLGYDNGRKQFTSSFVCNMGTGTHNGVGTADSSGKTLTFRTEAYCPVQEKVVNFRDVIRIESNDRIVFESYLLDEGKEVKTMEIVNIRAK
jgi:hypothetical protein